jgi:hypothetical protein
MFGKLPARPTTMNPGWQAWVYDEFKRETWFTYNGYQSGHYDQPEKLLWLLNGPPAKQWVGRLAVVYVPAGGAVALDVAKLAGPVRHLVRSRDGAPAPGR